MKRNAVQRNDRMEVGNHSSILSGHSTSLHSWLLFLWLHSFRRGQQGGDFLAERFQFFFLPRAE